MAVTDSSSVVRGGQRLSYRPGLDGLRALAVAAVLLYHIPVGWMKGGWLGVSAFFVLSGFLITTLLLAEQDGTGRIDRLAFWARRFRRLLPASLACLAGVVVLVVVGLLPKTPTLRGDLLAALFDVANWRVWATGGYDALWRAPSPVAHFWSLAIEEQWYFIWPIVAALLLARSRRAFTIGVAVGVLLAFGSGLFISPELAYLATFTRAAELLVGAGLALALHRWPLRPSPLLTTTGFVSLAAVLVSFSLLPLNWPWLFKGGLLAFAGIVAVLVGAAVTPGPVASVLSVPPLVWLGVRSYGVYLYHWPVYLVLEQRDWSTWWGIPITLVVADVSYRFLERPIRQRAWPAARPAQVLAPAAVAVVALAAVLVTPTVSSTTDLRVLVAGAATTLPGGATAGIGAGAAATTGVPASSAPPVSRPGSPTTAGASSGAGSTAPAPTTAPPPPTTTLPPAPVRITVVGDSTADSLGQGLLDWGTNTGRAVVSNRTISGCGLIRPGSMRFAGKTQGVEVPEGCRNWAQRWPPQLAEDSAEVVLTTVSPWEWIPRRWQGSGGGWLLPTDAPYRQLLAQEFAEATAVLTAGGRQVVWVTAAPINPGWGTVKDSDPAKDDAQRRVANDVLRQVMAGKPGVTVVDLAAWVEANPTVANDHNLRPDGVHWSRAAAEQVIELVVAPALAQG